MFNIGFGEFLVIAIVLIIVVGPDRLPALMRTVGKTIRGVRQASHDLRTSVGLDELMHQDLLRQPPRPADFQRPSAVPRGQASSTPQDQPGEPAKTDATKQASTAEQQASPAERQASTAEAPDKASAAQGEAKSDTRDAAAQSATAPASAPGVGKGISSSAGPQRPKPPTGQDTGQPGVAANAPAVVPAKQNGKADPEKSS